MCPWTDLQTQSLWAIRSILSTHFLTMPSSTSSQYHSYCLVITIEFVRARTCNPVDAAMVPHQAMVGMPYPV